MKFGRLAALAAGAILVAGAADATTILITLYNTDTGDIFSWDQSSTPVGVPAGPFETIVPVSNFEVNSVADPAVTTVEFYGNPVGGLQLPAAFYVNDSGNILFSGSLTAPIFETDLPGSALNNAVTGDVDVISIQSLGGPEPATWALVLTGFAGLGAALRRRRQVAAAA